MRRINFIQPEQFPYKSATGAVYDTGDYSTALQKALDLIDYPALRADIAEKRHFLAEEGSQRSILVLRNKR